MNIKIMSADKMSVVQCTLNGTECELLYSFMHEMVDGDGVMAMPITKWKNCVSHFVGKKYLATTIYLIFLLLSLSFPPFKVKCVTKKICTRVFT